MPIKPVEDFTTQEKTDFRAAINAETSGAAAAAQAAAVQRANHTGTQALSTLSQSGATSGQVPTWNGSAWAPADGAGGFDPTQVAFYDDFSLYQDGTQLTDAVTLPKVGTAWKFRENDTTAPSVKPFVFAGGLHQGESSSGYLAGYGTPTDIEHFSYGFKFTREPNQSSTDTRRNFTVCTGRSPTIDPTGSHSAYGKIHANIKDWAIESIPIYDAGWDNSSASASTDIITLGTWNSNTANAGVPEFSIQTGDAVAVWTPVPGGVTSGKMYYAVVVGTKQIKLAETKAQALAGTPVVNITADSSGFVVTRILECLNRSGTNGTGDFPWVERKRQALKFQGASATSRLATTQRHGLAVNDPVLLSGAGLPSPLAADTVYYVESVPTAFTVTLKSSLTGSAITLTTNGSADQMLTSKGVFSAEYSTGVDAMQDNRQHLLVVDRDGDYINWTLVGVGTIQFYFRNMSEIFGTGEVGFYFQSPARVTNGAYTYPVITTLNAAWIDAPQIQSIYMRQAYGYLADLAAGKASFGGRFDLLNPGNGAQNSVISGYLTNARMLAGGSSRSADIGGLFRVNGGNVVAEGAFVVPSGFADDASGVTNIGICPVHFKDNINTAATRATSGTLVTIPFAGPVDAGDSEDVTILGYTTGTNAKKITLYPSPGGTNLDTGTSLDTLDGPFRIDIHRKVITGANMVIYSTITLPNGTTLPTVRTSGNATTYPSMNLVVTITDANSITVESMSRKFNRGTVR